MKGGNQNHSVHGEASVFRIGDYYRIVALDQQWARYNELYALFSFRISSLPGLLGTIGGTLAGPIGFGVGMAAMVISLYDAGCI